MEGFELNSNKLLVFSLSGKAVSDGRFCLKKACICIKLQTVYSFLTK